MVLVEVLQGVSSVAPMVFRALYSGLLGQKPSWGVPSVFRGFLKTSFLGVSLGRGSYILPEAFLRPSYDLRGTKTP